MRKAKVALASVVAVFCFYGGKEWFTGSHDEGVKALLVAALAGALLAVLVWKSK
jgi:hypothetical protein